MRCLSLFFEKVRRDFPIFLCCRSRLASVPPPVPSSHHHEPSLGLRLKYYHILLPRVSLVTSLNVSLALVAFTADTSDRVLVVLLGALRHGLLVLLRHGPWLFWVGKEVTQAVEDADSREDAGRDTGECLDSLALDGDRLAWAVGAERDKVC